MNDIDLKFESKPISKKQLKQIVDYINEDLHDNYRIKIEEPDAKGLYWAVFFVSALACLFIIMSYINMLN